VGKEKRGGQMAERGGRGLLANHEARISILKSRRSFGEKGDRLFRKLV